MFNAVLEEIAKDIYSSAKNRFFNTENSTELGIRRWKRGFCPQDYMLMIPSFSAVKQEHKLESDVFEAGGYKWRLHVYPNGDGTPSGRGHVSLYLRIEDTAALPPNWEVFTDFKLFLYNNKNDSFLTVQVAEGAAKRFHEMKKEWGVSDFISLKTFADEGYLEKDCCYFGAEVIVIQKTTKKQGSLSLDNRQPATNNEPKGPSVDEGSSSSKRDIHSLSYSLNIERFSLLERVKSAGERSKSDEMQRVKSDGTVLPTYESEVFEAGGYKWRLCLYLNGRNRQRHVSLYLQVDGADALPRGWEVHAKIKFFVLNQPNDEQVFLGDEGGTTRFHGGETRSFENYISIERLKDFLHEDRCAFGTEVCIDDQVGDPIRESETLEMVQKPPGGSFNMKIENFSKQTQAFLCSEPHTAGDKNWIIKVYPRGKDDPEGRYLSVFLELVDGERLSPKKREWAEFKLQVLNQDPGKHKERTVSCCFTSSSNVHGERHLMSLHKKSAGFVANDTLTVGVEILVVSVTRRRREAAR